jgi:hypothetical protein
MRHYADAELLIRVKKVDQWLCDEILPGTELVSQDV